MGMEIKMKKTNGLFDLLEELNQSFIKSLEDREKSEK